MPNTSAIAAKTINSTIGMSMTRAVKIVPTLASIGHAF